ncbi:MAG: AraC family transcriptional regulator [Cytophagales bacterium]|nr:AraC family transcriptional regulator [Rhizobacter sp.]
MTEVPSPRAATPIRIYLQGGIASLVALPRLPLVKASRHDAIIMLSVDPDAVFSLSAGGLCATSAAAAIAPATPHTLQAGEARTVSISVHLVHPLFPAMRAFTDQPVKALDRKAFAHLDRDLYDASVGHLDLDRASQLIDAVLAAVLAHAPPTPPLDPRIRQIMQTMDQDFNYPFDKLAADLQISPSRLSHLFSKELGLPFRSYMAWSRLVLAWEMVALKPEMSFTEIAHIWGFSDSSHMARNFHLKLGMTPTTMRDRSIVEIIGTPMPLGQHLPLEKPPSSSAG